MKVKSIISGLLLLFVAVSIVTIIVRENNPGEIISPEIQNQTVVYYFHGNQRCVTCNTIEKYVNETVNEFFNEKLSGKEIIIKSINLDEPANAHFVKLFDLSSRIVVVANYTDTLQPGWEKLNRVWELVSDEKIFKMYIKDGIQSVLDGKST